MAKVCVVCGKRAYSDYCMQHKPRKPIATRTPLPRPRKRIRSEAVKTREKRLQTTADWYAANPPDDQGNWDCYISKHPLCPKKLTVETIVLEHDISKVRDKTLRYDINNIHPACTFDNAAKGSLSAKEYMAI